MTESFDFAQEIYSRYGSIKRARGPFLYTAKGVRLTDLYQEAGRAILGWGGGDAFTHLKNVLNRGITGSYITDFDYRMDKALSELFNSPRKVFVFDSKARALEAALNVFPESTSVWRPWAGTGVKWDAVDAVIVEPPLPWTSDIFIAAFNQSQASLPKLCEIKNSKKLPAPMQAAVVRSVYDMIKALQTRSEKDWFVWDKVLTKYWKREGPYLYPHKEILKEENYKDFVLHCLDCGVVVSPQYNVPSIVPFGADRGVFSNLAKNPFSCKSDGE